jgi:hypothetical protein
VWLPSGMSLRLLVQTRCTTRRSMSPGHPMHALIFHIRAHPELESPPRLLRSRSRCGLDRVGMVLGPEWCRTTLLVWAVLFFMLLGASHAIKATHITKPSHQLTPCLMCIIQNCWRRGRGGIRPRHRSRAIHGM